MLENVSDPGKLIGVGVTGNRETDLGTVDAVYLDTATDRPEWVAVMTGLFGSRVSVMPLNEAEYRDGVLHLPYTREQARNAPHQDLDHELSPDDERRLFGHFMQDELPEQQRGIFLAGDDISFTAGWAEGAVTTALNAVWGTVRHLGGRSAPTNPGPGDLWDTLAPVVLD